VILLHDAIPNCIGNRGVTYANHPGFANLRHLMHRVFIDLRMDPIELLRGSILIER
jgi:hypothetical protein